MVSVLPKCFTSSTADSSAIQMASDRRLKDHFFVNSRISFQEALSLDYGSGHDAVIVSSIFDFQKAERAPQRVPLAPFSKPAPSKWDDAQKWIASPTSNRPKMGQGGQGVGSRKIGNVGSRQPSTKVVAEVPDQKMVAFEEPDTKWVDTSQAKTETGVQNFVSWEADAYPVADSYGKSVLLIENSVGESTSKKSSYFVWFICLIFFCSYLSRLSITFISFLQGVDFVH